MFAQGLLGVDDKFHVDLQRIPMMIRNDIGGTGSTNLKHFNQILKTGKFESFDRSDEGGAKAVPYPTEKLMKNLANTQLLLISGTKDSFSQPADIESLKTVLPKENTKHILIEDYNHNDYMWAKDCDTFVNVHVMDFFKI